MIAPLDGFTALRYWAAPSGQPVLVESAGQTDKSSCAVWTTAAEEMDGERAKPMLNRLAARYEALFIC